MKKLLVLLIFGVLTIVGCTQKTSLGSECDSFSNLGYKDRTDCLIQLGTNSGDLRICDLIDGERKDSCYFGVGGVTKNPSICDKITSINKKNSCYKGLAERISDPSLCAKIEVPASTNELFPGDKETCYATVAVSMDDSSVCNKIESINFRTLCIAVIKKDSSICEDIRNADVKRLCLIQTPK